MMAPYIAKIHRNIFVKLENAAKQRPLNYLICVDSSTAIKTSRGGTIDQLHSPGNFTTIHRRLARLDRHLCLGEPSYLPG